MMRLNLGCGGQQVPGWLNVDRIISMELGAEQQGETLVLDLVERQPWPWDDDSVAWVVMHHVLDLLSPDELTSVLREIYRVLEPGGTLRVSSFDYGKAADQLYARNLDWFRQKGAASDLGINEAYEWLCALNGARRTILTTPNILGHLVAEVGFSWAERPYRFTAVEQQVDAHSLYSIDSLDTRADESWYLEATK